MRILIAIFLFPFLAFPQETKFHEDILKILDSSKYELGLVHLNRQLHDHPGDIYSYKLRGNTRVHLNNYNDALADYNVYLHYYPNDAEALFARANLHYGLGSYSQAVEDYLILIKSNQPQQTNYLYFQTSTNSQTQRKIFTMEGASSTIYHYHIGNCYYHLEQYDKALTYYDSALLYNHQNEDYIIAKALANEKLGNITDAIDGYMDVITQSPDNSLAMSNLGNLHLRSGNTEEAKKYLFESLMNSELSYPYADLAMTYLNNNELIPALENFNEAIKRDRGNSNYYLNRGKVYLKLKNYNEAEGDFTKVMELNPDNEQAYFNLGVVEYKKGNYQKAIELYDIALFYYPDYALALYNRAIAYFELLNLTAACNDIQKAQSLGIEISTEMSQAFCND